MLKLLRKIRLYFVNQELESLTFWMATNKTGGLKKITRYNKLQRIKRRLEE